MLPIRVVRPDRQVLRFGIGLGAHPLSPLWRLWVRGDEVYLAVRDSLRISKFSLHSNGQWQLRAGTMMRALLPRTPYALGWEQGPTIDFPVLVVPGPLPVVHEPPRKQFLLAPPQVGAKVAFGVHFALGVPDAETVTRDFPAAAGIAGPLRLRNGDSVWLVGTVLTMAPTEVEQLRAEVAGLRVNMSRPPDGTERGWLLSIIDVPRVGTVVRHHMLRPGNFVHDSPKIEC